MTEPREARDGDRLAQKNVSERLMDLYAVGAGLALAIGVERMVRFSGDLDAEVRWASLPVFVALLATLIPFYHGALRHLYQRWIDDSGMTGPAMMVDFLMLFLGVAVMFVMAYVVTQPWAFALALLALLVIDCLWALTFDFLVGRSARGEGRGEWLRTLTGRGWRFVARSRGSSEPGGSTTRGAGDSDPAELNWLWLNLWALAVAVPTLVVVTSTDVSTESVGFALAIMVFAVVRTVLDYWVNADFYFPGAKPTKAKQASTSTFSTSAPGNE